MRPLARALGAIACAWPLTSVPVLAAAPADRVLVMPFENAGRVARLHWLSEASSILVAEEMSRAGADVIARDERRQAFDRLQLPVAAVLSLATMIRVGQLVGATDLVVGSFELDGTELVVRARRVRLDAGRASPEQTERGPLADLMAVFESTGRRLSATDAGATPIAGAAAEARAPAPAARPPMAAFENFVKGLLAEVPATQVRFLDAALALHPGYTAARLALWHVWTAEGDHARALAAVGPAVDDASVGLEARFLASRSEIALQRYDAAIGRLAEIGGSTPPAPVSNNVGVAQLRKQDAGSAARAAYYFSQAAQRDPGDADYCFNLGYAYALMRDNPAALYWLRETVRRRPADAGAHRVLAAVLRATGAQVEAERERELARQLGQADEPAPRQGGDPVQRGLERVKSTLGEPANPTIDAVLGEAGQRDQRELAAFHLDRGRRLFAERNDREAVAEIGRAVFLVPYAAEAHLLLGRIYLRAGRVGEAISAFTLAVWCEDSAAGRVALAEAHLEARNLEAARAELAKALAIDPKSAEAAALAARLGRRP